MVLLQYGLKHMGYTNYLYLATGTQVKLLFPKYTY
jgi:hypothetical protein